MRGFEGSGAILIVDENKIIIKRKGVLSFLNHGSKGDKEIFIKNITAIQLKKPWLTKGFIQFSLSGETASKGGVFDAVKDENSILIGDSKQYNDFVKAKELIESKINQSSNPTTIIQNTYSVADELTKLVSLKDLGILTKDEFEIQKQKILNK